MEVRCPVCQTSFKVGENGTPINPNEMNGIGYLVPETVRTECCKENKKMTKTEERKAKLEALGFDVDKMLEAGLDLSKYMKDDAVVEEIYKNGYVKNTKLHRRFITAMYIKLLGWNCGVTKSHNAWNGKDYEYDKWTENFNKYYAYDYQFEYLIKELHVLGKLEVADKECFEERVKFFNKDVVAALIDDYLEKLTLRLKSYKTKNCKGLPYIKFKGEDIFVADIEKKIIAPLRYKKRYAIVNAKSYLEMEELLRDFCKDKKFSKLPINTTKCAKWVDAFKGSGAFYTALNLIRYDGCRVHVDNKVLDKYESEKVLREKVIEYKNNWWKLHAFTKKLIVDNDFNLNEFIKK